MEYRTLISQFSARIGVADVSFNEDNIVRLQADDMEFSFMEIPERNALLIWSKVATPPPEKLEQLYRLLLEATFMGRAVEGGAFSLDGGAVYLHRVDSLTDLEPEALEKIFEGFVNLVEKWKEVIKAFRADDTAGEANPPELGFGGYMQV